MNYPFTSPLFPKPRAERPQRRELTKEEQEGILFAFETLDSERRSYVTQKQLKVALRAMGFGVKKADVLELLQRHGEENNDQLDFATFKTVVSDKLQDRTLQDEYRRAFQLFDVLGIGSVDLATLKRIVKSLNLEIDDAELQDMIAQFDQDKDGSINEQEFLAIMTASDD